ncbi:hypothetical protein EPH95_07500 [Salicibibacter halophilus]|uniref:LiaF transmembrane domain-containing protein n=1 Tax=Salicibibacter halophilus TaxID=2502791 RepID=A0A514LGR3_9BACI|nr:hypothetical protein [Salicibibacter halophilus]QDI91048.1 hypothetical protein EPH95_07500 [Salicibibacter halophilus]
MKNNQIFPAMIFIGAGAYYLTHLFAPEVAAQWMTWETLLIWLGLALSMDGFFSKAGSALLPGIFMIGIGVHFHAIALYPNWPNNIGILAAFFGIACMIAFLRTQKDFLFVGILSICIGALFLFFEPAVERIAEASDSFSFIWPLLLLVLGVFLLFRRKKKRHRKGAFRKR